jgi:hypothetical protein
MEFDLYFCNDGVLRAKLSDKQPLLPLSLIQSQSEKSDLNFWSYWWGCNTYFEDGLTIATFLECLEPWKDFCGEFIGKDIGAYIKEVRKPTLVKEKEDSIDWIGLSFRTEISPNVSYERELEDDLLPWLNADKKIKLKKIKLTGDWHIDGHYQLSGYKNGYVEHYSIDSMAMNEIANIPLYLNNKQFLYVSDYRIGKLLSEDNMLLNKIGFGIREIKSEDINKKSFKYISADKENSFRDVIEGFFWWFASTPVHREEINDEIKKSIEEYEKSKDRTDLSDNPKEEVIVSVTENEKLKVDIAPNAFSGLIEESNRKKDYWEQMIKVAKQDNIVIRIGQCTSVGFPEDRIFAYIAKDEDLSTDYL